MTVRAYIAIVACIIVAAIVVVIFCSLAFERRDHGIPADPELSKEILLILKRLRAEEDVGKAAEGLTMKRPRKTKAQREQERTRSDKRVWDGFRPKLEAVQCLRP